MLGGVAETNGVRASIRTMTEAGWRRDFLLISKSIVEVPVRQLDVARADCGSSFVGAGQESASAKLPGTHPFRYCEGWRWDGRWNDRCTRWTRVTQERGETPSGPDRGNILGVPITDTSPSAQAVQTQVQRTMTGEQRLLVAFDMSLFARELANERIRREYPEWPETRVARELVRLAFLPAPMPARLR